MRPNSKQKNTKQKLTVTIYQKVFNTIDEMIKEFRDLHPEFVNIFKYEENSYPDQVSNDVLLYFSNNHPDIANRTNLAASVNVSANKVSLKTNKYFSVEWSFKYDKEGNISNLVSTIGVFTKEKNHEDLDNLITNLNNYSWEVITK